MYALKIKMPPEVTLVDTRDVLEVTTNKIR